MSKRCRSNTPTACEQLALAEAQMALMQTGKSVRVIETPQLGRVEFAPCSMADLGRRIEQLRAACNAEQGLPSGRRRPISVEAWP